MNWPGLIDSIKNAAEQGCPFEVCGLIDDDGKLIACTNSAQDRTRAFYIHPEEFKRVARNRNVVGVYHSHVDQGAYISEHDKTGMTFSGLYVVVSVIEGVGRELKVWLYKDSKFTPVSIPER